MKNRGRRRKIRIAAAKAAVVLSLVAAVYYAAAWAIPRWDRIREYLDRFGVAAIDTAEVDRYYDLLSAHGRPGKGLVLDLGVGDKEDLQAVVDRLKGLIGVTGNKIWLAHHNAERPPAYIEELGYGDMGILISSKITDRREEINLLVHELGHIYVWKLEKSVFGKCDQEKLNDCSGVFLGLGILMLNGLTDEIKMGPGGMVEERKKRFGYLKPEQSAYLLARYCAEGGIPERSIRPFLSAAAREYFDAACKYFNIKNRAVKTKAVKSVGLYWCPKCGSFARTDFSGKAGMAKCPDCGTPARIAAK